MQIHLPVVLTLDTDEFKSGVVVLEECPICDATIRQTKMKTHLNRHDKKEEESSGSD